MAYYQGNKEVVQCISEVVGKDGFIQLLAIRNSNGYIWVDTPLDIAKAKKHNKIRTGVLVF